MSEETKEQEQKEALYKYESCTDEKIKEIALGCINKHIFTSQHVRDANDIPHVFMAYGLGGSAEHSEWMRENDIAVFYEYMNKAAPRGINGNPVFFSHSFLSENDWKRVLDKVEKIKSALEDV